MECACRIACAHLENLSKMENVLQITRSALGKILILVGVYSVSLASSLRLKANAS